jgi:hypothetical protein
MRDTTRQRYTAILRFMHQQEKPFTLEEVKVKMNAHTQILTACKGLGLIEKTRPKYYRWVGDVPTKTTANRVYANVVKSTTKKPVRQPVKRSISRPELRTASLLWGLIKFNY